MHIRQQQAPVIIDIIESTNSGASISDIIEIIFDEVRIISNLKIDLA